MIQKAEKLLSRGRLPRAITLLEEALSGPDRDAPAASWLFLGDLNLHARKPRRALEAAQKALDLEGNSADALHLLGLAALDLGDPVQARARALACLEARPDHPGGRDLLLILDGKHVRPETREKVRRLREKGAKGQRVRVSIHSRSDREPDPAMRRMWGDHWVKEELIREFSALGMTMDDDAPDMILHFFGSPAKELPRDAYKVVWFFSHPDMVDCSNLRQFDKIFCASENFMPNMRAMGYPNVEYLPACTSKKPCRTETLHDMVFLGNARASRPDGRQVVGDMRATGFPFKVWGNLWDRLLPPENYGGLYWDYDRLEELYAAAWITLNDHHPDMAREGFVSNKVFDILASGGFVISEKNAGLEGVFGGAAPQYETPEQLRALVDYFLHNPQAREALRIRGQEIALQYTYQKCAARLAADCSFLQPVENRPTVG